MFRRAITVLAAFTLGVVAWVASAPPANAFVLHDDVNETTCAYTAEGSVRIVLYYWSWTDGSGVKWVAMKSGKHIRLDIAAGSAQTVMDPEVIDLQANNILYDESGDFAAGDSSSVYIMGIPGNPTPQVNALDFTINATDGHVYTSDANNGIQAPWTPIHGAPVSTPTFLHQFRNSDRPFINFDWEPWTPGDDANLPADCNLVMVNHF